MTSCLTSHHFSWCRACLERISSTSPDMKRSWKLFKVHGYKKILGSSGISWISIVLEMRRLFQVWSSDHLRTKIALLLHCPGEHSIHPVISLRAFGKPAIFSFCFFFLSFSYRIFENFLFRFLSFSHHCSSSALLDRSLSSTTMWATWRNMWPFHIHHQIAQPKSMVKVQISRDMMTEVENDYGNRQQVEVLSMLK